MSQDSTISFSDLDLPSPIVDALASIGYESPSPIQEKAIPVLMAGRDIIGQAQTGTGKTAAFALPTLANIDLKCLKPQVCVICPTRELAIQVAEAFGEYAKRMKGFRVLPIYGGQSYSIQLRELKRGAQVIVGTPGRLMDHMRRGTLNWDNLKTLVLDEADEMLRMGFMEDVEWILDHLPEERQIALFSATMPKPIAKVAKTFLDEPELIKIESRARTATTIKQQFLTVQNNVKIEALTRILESVPSDATIVFTRTKSNCDELAKKIMARGFSVEAIHGDMQQKQRERIVQQLKEEKIDIVVATDVAARGLDVERISHVINYDIPQDPESYVHRIGRTGRAGREGTAISFVTPREHRLLKMIERCNATRIEKIRLPSIDVINEERMRRFKVDLEQQIELGLHEDYMKVLQDMQADSERTDTELAAALASLLFKNKPLLLDDLPEIPEYGGSSKKVRDRERGSGDRDRERGGRDRERGGAYGERRKQEGGEIRTQPGFLKSHPEVKLDRYVIHVGRSHGVTPKHIVGAIANEAELESDYIGDIKLYDDMSTVDLPEGMPKDVLQHLKKARICGNRTEIELAKEYVRTSRKEGGDARGNRSAQGGWREGKADQGRRNGGYDRQKSRKFSDNKHKPARGNGGGYKKKLGLSSYRKSEKA